MPGRATGPTPAISRSGCWATYFGYPDERWLDIREIGALAPILRKRFDLALCTAVVWLGILNIRTSTGADRLFLLGCLAAVTAFAAVLMTHVPSPGTTVIAALSAGALAAAPPRSTHTADKPHRAPRGLGRTAVVASAAGCTIVGCGAVLAAAAELPLKSATNDIYAGNLTRASRSFDIASSLRPWDADVALLAGQSFAGRASAGDPAAGRLAATWAAESLHRNPASVESLLSLAVGQLAAGEVDQAQRTLAKARQLAPANSQIWLQSGLAEHAAGDTRAAISSVQKAVSLTPDPAEELKILYALQDEIAVQGTGP